MRRIATILLIVLFAALGSGAMLHVHNDGAAAADHHDAGERHHDEGNCLVHALLAGPMLADGVTPLLVCLGLFVAFLTMLASQPAIQRVLTRLDCRGPPARLLIPA